MAINEAETTPTPMRCFYAGFSYSVLLCFATMEVWGDRVSKDILWFLFVFGLFSSFADRYMSALRAGVGATKLRTPFEYINREMKWVTMCAERSPACGGERSISGIKSFNAQPTHSNRPKLHIAILCTSHSFRFLIPTAAFANRRCQMPGSYGLNTFREISLYFFGIYLGPKQKPAVLFGRHHMVFF